MAQDERRLAAIMFTDIQGYTALAQSNESLALKALAEHRDLLRPLFTKHGGREVKTMGDAFLVEFGSALAAVECAVEIQRASRDFVTGAGSAISVRVGIHVGDVVHQGGDVLGDAVNIASRIEPLAEAGGICISQQVFDQVRNKLPYRLVRLEPRALKNVSYQVDAYKLELPWQATAVSATPVQDKRRIAVLPLVNMTSDPNDEYFADGMTEEMISTLSNISGLSVISRTSAMQYKGAKKNLSDIGRELNAGTMLEGSVRKAGNRVRITVQLIDSAEDKHIWAQSYDRELQDIFAVQSDIATSVADALKVKLLDREAAQIKKKPTENTEAFMLYLKGRQYWNKRTKDSLNKALGYFELAMEQDPNFALAYVGVADVYDVLADHGYLPASEAGPKATQAVLRALDLDSGLAEAHATYAGTLAGYQWKWDEAEMEYKRAIELNPNYASAHQWYSILLRERGRLEEALVEAKRALELDPLAPTLNMNVGDRLFVLERYDEAIEYFVKALAIDPNFIPALGGLTSAYVEKSMFDKALVTIAKSATLFPSQTRIKFAQAGIYGRAGRLDEGRQLLEEALRGMDTEFVPPNEVASAYAGLGETEKMFEWLQKGIFQRDSGLLYLKADPTYKRFRSDPRFQETLRTIGL